MSDIYQSTPYGRKGKGLTHKGLARYANPDDRSQTWTGRGRRPDWLIARRKKGEKIEKFAI